MVAVEKKEVKEKQEVITAVYKLNLYCQECARSIEKHIIILSAVGGSYETDREHLENFMEWQWEQDGNGWWLISTWDVTMFLVFH